MKQKDNSKISRLFVGILGGIGPLASLEFINSIHKFDLLHNQFSTEQNFSKYILLCDPSIPDRTQNLLNNKHVELQVEVEKRLQILNNTQVDYIIPVCFTVSTVLNNLSHKFKIISVVGIAMKEILARNQKVLILCTNGTRMLNIFCGHPLWDKAKHYMTWPDDLDQLQIHELIYQIKIGGSIKSIETMIDQLLIKYQTPLWLAGCTELHLLTSLKYFKEKTFNFIDPFLSIAQMISANQSEFLGDTNMIL
ncbi:MAG TPA: aspartate/glutamate racemase family protein [Aquella sp.]|nr:aspartate/glutamate racemase family protein [Aquella sp.]